MKFKRLFYDNKMNFRSVSKAHILLSVLIGVCSATLIYTAFSYFKEIFRLMSFGFGMPLDIVIEEHRVVYNFFFASLSLIFGNSIAISFLMSISRSIFSRGNNKQHRIINDQVFLNFNFMSWFGKIAVMMGLFSLVWFDFKYLPFLVIPMILLVLTLYLETWKTIILVLPKKKYKILLFHFLTIGVLATGLSQINVMDYKKMDQSLLKQRPAYDLPRSCFSQNDNYRWYPIIELKLVVDNNETISIIGEDNLRVSLNSLSRIISLEREFLREELIPRMAIKLTANKNVDLKIIKKVEAEILANDIYKILYNLHDENRYTRRLSDLTLTKRLHYSDIKYRDSNYSVIPNILPPALIWSRFDNEKKYDTLRINVNGIYSVYGTKIPEKMLVRYLKNRITSKTIFEYYYAEQTTYQDYITLFSAHTKAINGLQIENQKKFKEYGLDIKKARRNLIKSDYDIYKIELNELKLKYPRNIIEVFD